MESYTFVKLEDDDSISQLLACRVCLETESKLFDVHRNGSAVIFGELTGTQVTRTDGLPQYLCGICKELLHKTYAFRTKCRQAHILLQDARVRQPFMTTSHIRSLDRSKFKHKFSCTNALKISIPAEKDITIEELSVEKNSEKDHLVKSESLIYCEDEIPNDFDESIDHLDMYINEKDTNIELESTSIKRIDKQNENLLMKREGLIYCDNEITKDFKESIDQLDTDINLEFPEISQETHNIQATINNVFEQEIQKFEEITKEVYNKKRTKKKSPTKNKEETTKPKKVREKKRKRPCNMKFIEDYAEFNETYNCEVLFLTREQQLTEIEERKESVSFKKARFQCMICYKGFMNDNAHGKHMVMHDKSSGDHICDVCQARFNSRKQMLSHNRQHKYRFVCKTCDHVSIHSYLAKAHFKWHEGFKYECKECNKQFNSLSTHLNHKRSYHSPVTCEVCNATVSGTKGLKEHNETIHSAAKYPCATCKAKFESQEAFDKHLNPDNRCITYFPCTKCGENFSNEQQLYKHTESSHGNTLFRCEECQAVYTSGRRLAAHWTLRHSKLTYMCEVCARTFPSECMLQEHQRLHTGEKPYQCAMCPKRFRQKIHLKVHINTHTGERPFKCAHCEDTFKSYSQRHKHILMVHKKERRHKCHMCDKTYVVSFDLKMHIRTYHMKIPLPPPNRRKSRRKQQ